MIKTLNSKSLFDSKFLGDVEIEYSGNLFNKGYYLDKIMIKCEEKIDTTNERYTEFGICSITHNIEKFIWDSFNLEIIRFFGLYNRFYNKYKGYNFLVNTKGIKLKDDNLVESFIEIGGDRFYDNMSEHSIEKIKKVIMSNKEDVEYLAKHEDLRNMEDEDFVAYYYNKNRLNRINEDLCWIVSRLCVNEFLDINNDNKEVWNNQGKLTKQAKKKIKNIMEGKENIKINIYNMVMIVEKFSKEIDKLILYMNKNMKKLR